MRGISKQVEKVTQYAADMTDQNRKEETKRVREVFPRTKTLIISSICIYQEISSNIISANLLSYRTNKRKYSNTDRRTDKVGSSEAAERRLKHTLHVTRNKLQLNSRY